MSLSASRDVRSVVAHLAAHGSAGRAAGIQRFFKEEVRAHGWRTADLRRYALTLYRQHRTDLPRLLAMADALFSGRFLEEKALGVIVLQRAVPGFGPAEFRRFEGWLSRVTTWADHDALAMYLLGPMLTADPRRARRVFIWARSRHRWHRRAAAVALIDGVRRGLFAAEASAITRHLLTDADDMVQKGLGWLLREWGKARPAETIPLLTRLRGEMPRLVLRTACERLPADARRRLLARKSIPD